MAGPGDVAGREQQADLRRRAVGGFDEAGLGAHEGEHGGGMGDGGGEADAAGGGGDGGEAREAQSKLVAALGARQGVDFVDDDAAEMGEKAESIVVREEEQEGFWGGEQDVWRGEALAGAVLRGCIAAAGFDADVDADIGDGGGEVARDVGAQGFERADINCVQAAAAGLGERDEAGEEAGHGLAGAGGGDEEGVFAAGRGVQHGGLVGA